MWQHTVTNILSPTHKYRNRDLWWTVVPTVIITECIPQKQGISWQAKWILISEEGICWRVTCSGDMMLCERFVNSWLTVAPSCSGQVDQELCSVNSVTYLSSVLSTFFFNFEACSKESVKSNYLHHVCMSACLTARNYFVPNGRIFTKFNTEVMND